MMCSHDILGMLSKILDQHEIHSRWSVASQCSLRDRYLFFVKFSDRRLYLFDRSIVLGLQGSDTHRNELRRDGAENIVVSGAQTRPLQHKFDDDKLSCFDRPELKFRPARVSSQSDSVCLRLLIVQLPSIMHFRDQPGSAKP